MRELTNAFVFAFIEIVLLMETTYKFLELRSSVTLIPDYFAYLSKSTVIFMAHTGWVI